MLDTSDEWIQTRTGMRERHIAAPGEPTSDIALAAARDALRRAGLEPEAIDCVIVATVTPDYIFPATGCILADKLGITGKPAFDIEIACSGFIYGLTVGVEPDPQRRLPAHPAGRRRGALEHRQLRGPHDRGAVRRRRRARSCSKPARWTRSSPPSWARTARTPSAMLIPAGGTVTGALTHDDLDAQRNQISMRGREVFRFAVTKMIDSTNVALEPGRHRAARGHLADPAPGQQAHHRRRRQAPRPARPSASS